MSLPDRIWLRLANYAPVQAILGQRIYAGRAPQDAATPFAVYQLIGRSSEEGDPALFRWRVQIDSYAPTYAAAWSAGEALRGAMRMHQDRAGTPAVLNVLDEGAADGWDEEAKLHRITFDCFVMTYGD